MIRKKRKSKINLREKNIKVKTLDRYWSIAVKTRDNWKCVYCGNNKRDELEAHHIRARKHSEVKFDLDDGITLCKPYKGCSGHYKAHHSYEMKEWIKDYIGRKKYDELDRRSYQIKKWTPLEKRDLLKYFKEFVKENENGEK
jgi:hypothetical protein